MKKLLNMMTLILAWSVIAIPRPNNPMARVMDQQVSLPQPKPTKQVLKVQKHILKNNPKLDPKFSLKLAAAIEKTATEYKLDPKLLAAIFMQESRYDLKAVNQKSKDFGIAQINHKNIERMGLDRQRLMTDVDYSVKVGAKILASYKKTFHKREPSSWYCRYNIGFQETEEAMEKCETYKLKVARYM